MRYGVLLLLTIFSITSSVAATPNEASGCKDDNEAPKIECPETIYAYVVCDEKCASVEFDEPRAVDNCDPKPKVWCEFQSGYCFPIGKTEVWCWARDRSGNEAKHFFNIVVKQKKDTEAPHIQCPKDIVEYADCGATCVKVAFDEPAADDNCDENPKVWCEFQSGYCFPIGKTEVWCWARDKSGNESKHFFAVTVKIRPDKTAPEIRCPKDVYGYIDCRSLETCTSVNFEIPSAKDNCDSNPIVSCNYQSGYCFLLGTTAITCTAKDKNGNESQCTFNVIVKYNDMTPPVISCPKDMDIYADCNATCSRVMWWMDAMATDECDSNPKIWYQVNDKKIDRWYCFPLGSTTVTAYAQDKAGNKSSCYFNIVMKRNNDVEAPKITCPSDVTVTLPDCKMCGKVDYSTPKITDNCDKNPTYVCSVYDGVKQVDIDKDFCFMVGKTLVTCTATDASGNKAICKFWVTVIGKVCGGENPTHPTNSEEDDDDNPCPYPICSRISILPTKLNQLPKGHNLPSAQQLESKDFTLYPNPTIESVNLNLSQYNGKDVSIQVVNSVGQQVYNTIFKEVTEQSYRLDVQNYPKGVYLIKVSAEGAQVATKKMLKL
jgi:large repetitive protein